MPITSPSAFSGCKSLEKCLPPPRFGLLNLPPRPRAEDILASVDLCSGSEVWWVSGDARIRRPVPSSREDWFVEDRRALEGWIAAHRP